MRKIYQLSIFCLVCLSFFIFQNCQNTSNVETAAASADAGVQSEDLALQNILPPLEEIDVEFNSFEVQPTQAQTIEMENGSSIEIPANSFVDSKGNPISEPVKVHYREFHNAAQIMASGIPMEVIGENGEKAWMQTAGMFEMQATTKSGSEVFISEDKPVNVNMASYEDGEYPFWYFNPEKGNWEELGTNNPTPNPKMLKLEQESALSAKAEIPSQPAKPVKFDKSKAALNFNINYENFPDLKQMKGMVWQYAGDDAKADPVNNKWIFKEPWDYANLEAGDKPNQYQIVLSNSEKTFVIPAVPSRKGKHFEKAMKEFQKQSMEYKSYVENKTAQREMMQTQAEFVRSFSVQNLGIYNYDILIKRQGTIQVMADFDFGNLPSHVKKMIPVYLITGEGRSVVAFPRENWDRFVFDPQMANHLIAVLPGNKLATFSNNDFQDERNNLEMANKGDYVFKMQIHDQEVKSIEDIQHVLNVMS